MSERVRIGVLGSTRGTDLQAIIDAITAGSLLAEISLVLSDRKSAYILERARIHGIPAQYISGWEPTDQAQPVPESQGKVRKTRERFDAEMTACLEAAGVDLILLIGYMRIVSAAFCERWSGRLLNVHPSLLPDFAGGMDGDVHAAVLAAGRTETGCTVHQVTAEVDAGPILVQSRCPVFASDPPETLKTRVQGLEGAALIQAIGLLFPQSIVQESTDDHANKKQENRQ